MITAESHGTYISMVTQHMLRTHEGKFATNIDIIKCLKQNKKQIFLITCAPISELPSTKNTMAESFKQYIDLGN